MNDTPSNGIDKSTQSLITLLGFDPCAPAKLSTSVFAEIVQEVSEDRRQQVRTQAVDVLRKAMELRVQRVKAERAFKGEMTKFDKDLSGLLRKIQEMLDGGTPEGGDPTQAPTPSEVV